MGFTAILVGVLGAFLTVFMVALVAAVDLAGSRIGIACARSIGDSCTVGACCAAMFVVVLAGIGAAVGADVWIAFGNDALTIHSYQRTRTSCTASAATNLIR